MTSHLWGIAYLYPSPPANAKITDAWYHTWVLDGCMGSDLQVLMLTHAYQLSHDPRPLETILNTNLET